MELATDTRTGPYEVLFPLEAGAMGEVCVARGTRLDLYIEVAAVDQ